MAEPAPRKLRDNLLLASLPSAERDRIAPALEHVNFELRQAVHEPEMPLTHAWFPHSGVLSVVSEMQDGSVVELATVGREGMTGVPLALGTDRTPQRTFCQVPGDADRMTAANFRRLVDELPAFRGLIFRYAMALFSQIAQGVACNRLHPIEARCARWLLMTHDRVEGDTFVLTQEFLGQMLGVTRPSVSVAAGMLQKAGLIHYVRGDITVVDRPGLEAASCECYGLITGEFRRLIEGEN